MTEGRAKKSTLIEFSVLLVLHIVALIAVILGLLS